jgi:hypothetical protein
MRSIIHSFHADATCQFHQFYNVVNRIYNCIDFENIELSRHHLKKSLKTSNDYIESMSSQAEAKNEWFRDAIGHLKQQCDGVIRPNESEMSEKTLRRVSDFRSLIHKFCVRALKELDSVEAVVYVKTIRQPERRDVAVSEVTVSTQTRRRRYRRRH